MNTTSKMILAVISILTVAGLVVFYIWSSHNRYYIMSGSEGRAYEVDRKTGQSWLLYGARKIEQQGDEESHRKDAELPFEQASKITGNASISYGSFSGKLYNGSEWTVSRAILSVTAKNESGTVLWTRDFSTSLNIKSLTTGSFDVSVAGDYGVKNVDWNIKSVFGYKE